MRTADDWAPAVAATLATGADDFLSATRAARRAGVAPMTIVRAIRGEISPEHGCLLAAERAETGWKIAPVELERWAEAYNRWRSGRAKIELRCARPGCSTTFERWPSQRARDGHDYCSRECAHIDERHRRALRERLATTKAAIAAQAREELLAHVGGCGSPSCSDPDCAVARGRCHRSGCRRPARRAPQTHRGRRTVRGEPTLYCSALCAAMAIGHRPKPKQRVDVDCSCGCGQVISRRPSAIRETNYASASCAMRAAWAQLRHGEDVPPQLEALLAVMSGRARQRWLGRAHARKAPAPGAHQRGRPSLEATPQQVAEIRRLAERGWGRRAIAGHLALSPHLVWKVLKA